ncbi:LCP family protein [Anaerosolibacter sp.]|uniref:LCP family protein n=1 Tax=Anaerosolibacter sp. TaxID=1872527 RepID=UPI0039EEE64F
MKKFFKILVVAFVCFALMMGTGLYIFLNSISSGAGSENETIPEDAPRGNEPVNVLIVGVDAKDAKNANGVRTDTIMVANFDPKTKAVNIISIPRDTRVIIRGHKGQDKINHAHAYGGIDLAMKTVKDFLGINVDYYVRIDYKALGQIVDDLGGVEVDVPMNMKYTDPYADPPLKINLQKGLQVLDGGKAMQFVRFRKGYTDQDLGRIEAQHTFLKAVADKLLSPQTILKLPKLAKTFGTYVDTNMPASAIASYAAQAPGINMDSINMLTIPGEPKLISGIWYFIADKEKMNTMLEGLQYETEKGSNGIIGSIIQKKEEQEVTSKATVEVLNGSGVAGHATKVGKKLKDEGYNVVNINNINGMKYSQTHVYDRKNKASEAKKIAKLLDVKDIETDLNPDAEAEITIIVGSDWKE